MSTGREGRALTKEGSDGAGHGRIRDRYLGAGRRGDDIDVEVPKRSKEHNLEHRVERHEYGTVWAESASE